jgi:ABC-type lipoprotein export system ATPase subunit
MSDNELAGIRNAEIGFVFQVFNLLLSRSTALENVMLPWYMQELKKMNEKAGQLICLLMLVLPTGCTTGPMNFQEGSGSG